MWLLLFAAMIVFASLWYTNILATRISEEEQKQVRIWAQAVENKARLVKYMTGLFQRMANEERKKIELWASAYSLINDPSGEVNYFALEVLKNNETIPVIAVDENNEILFQRNLDSAEVVNNEGFTSDLFQKFNEYDPIVIENPLLNSETHIYYRDSRLFRDLKEVLRNFVSSFITEDVMKAASVPVIFTDSNDSIIEFSNIDSTELRNRADLRDMLESMKEANEPIVIDLGDGNINYVYYKNSILLNQITYYPYIQFAIIGLFLLVAYIAFSTARRAEQNQVWVGMSKETAHQLGTPISSLIAWVEYLRETGYNPDVVVELEKDVNRLELVAERFSKIGSLPTLAATDIVEILNHSISYLKTRASKKVIFDVNLPEHPVYVNLSPPLFDWVIENLIKNALDAMEGLGRISLTLTMQPDNKQIYIDITDTGKGIPGSKQKTVFQPGFSTKKRGWGLGLSLSKRIIENYHNGKIFVKESVLGKGTTFRIILPLAENQEK